MRDVWLVFNIKGEYQRGLPTAYVMRPQSQIEVLGQGLETCCIIQDSDTDELKPRNDIECEADQRRLARKVCTRSCFPLGAEATSLWQGTPYVSEATVKLCARGKLAALTEYTTVSHYCHITAATPFALL
jgi:hypothetical protein